jgi:hypothetical protein
MSCHVQIIVLANLDWGIYVAHCSCAWGTPICVWHLLENRVGSVEVASANERSLSGKKQSESPNQSQSPMTKRTVLCVFWASRPSQNLSSTPSH